MNALLPDGPWLDHINPEFLAAAYPAWAQAGLSFDDAAEAFRRHGFPALATIAPGKQFDPAYFRETNPGWETASDHACYRHWLMEGLPAGKFGAAPAHLESLGLPLTTYPEAFPWRYYARLRPAAGAHRWSALDDFCQRGFSTLLDSLPLGPDSQGLLLALGQKFSTVNDTLAIRAYELAQSHKPLPAAEQQHLADAYLRLGLWRPAMALYDQVASSGGSNGWTIRNFVKCAVRLEAWQNLLAGLDRARHEQSADPLWAATISDAISGMFESRARQARLLMTTGAYEAADTLLGRSVDDLAALAEKLSPPPPLAAPGAPRKLLIIANEDDAESAARRVHEKRALLDLLGQPYEIHPYTDSVRHMAALPHAAAVILFRVPALPGIIQLIIAARRRGITTIYETDAGLPASETAPPITFFRGKITSSLYDGFRFGLPLHAAAARLCDIGLAPTELLAASLRPVVRARRAFVLPNSLLPNPASRPAGEPDDRRRLFIRSASLGFLDAAQGTIGAILISLLQRRPEVLLQISGALILAPEFDAYTCQVIHLGPGAQPADYWPHLAMADINLAIQCDTPGDEYHAEQGWAEAAALGVASLLFIENGRLPAIRNGLNATRAATPQAWQTALDMLLEDPGLRGELAARARTDAALAEGTSPATQALQRILRDIVKTKDTHARVF
jgi:tetratricopeptide (TPR) repeat protein